MSWLMNQSLLVKTKASPILSTFIFPCNFNSQRGGAWLVLIFVLNPSRWSPAVLNGSVWWLRLGNNYTLASGGGCGVSVVILNVKLNWWGRLPLCTYSVVQCLCLICSVFGATVSRANERGFDLLAQLKTVFEARTSIGFGHGTLVLSLHGHSCGRLYA
jgi:hypothetical protein